MEALSVRFTTEAAAPTAIACLYPRWAIACLIPSLLELHILLVIKDFPLLPLNLVELELLLHTGINFVVVTH